MSAQKESKTSTSHSGERTQQSGLARRSIVPDVPSLLLDPLGFFDDSFSVFNRLFDINRSLGRARGLQTQRGPELALWVPAVEVNYREGNLVVSAELPGLTENDVDVQIVNDMLVIQGERRDEREEEQGGARRTEIRYGRFYRAIPVPAGAQTDDARAEFHNGILRVTIPVPQPQGNVRQIPVQATGTAQGKQPQKGEKAA